MTGRLPDRTMAAIKLDALDVKILAAIQREGRITKLALAERVGLSPTPCWRPPASSPATRRGSTCGW